MRLGRLEWGWAGPLGTAEAPSLRAAGPQPHSQRDVSRARSAPGRTSQCAAASTPCAAARRRGEAPEPERGTELVRAARHHPMFERPGTIT